MDCGPPICLGRSSRGEGLGNVTWQRTAVFSSVSGTPAETPGDGCPLVLPSSPRPVVSWELSQAGLVSSDESGNSGLCPAGLSGTLPPTPGVGPASAPPSWRQLQQGLRPRPLGPCVALPEAGIHVFFGAVLLRKRPFYSQETRQDEFLSPTYHLQIESRRRRRVLAGQGPAGSFPGRLVTKPAPVTPRSKARPGILAFWFAV